jgi:hypothetical protein
MAFTGGREPWWRRQAMRFSVPLHSIFALAVVLGVGSVGCSPLVRLEVRFALASRPATGKGATAWIGDRFHVVGAKICPPGPVDEPRAGDASSGAVYFNAEFDQGGVTALVAFRGKRCAVRALGWYDANGDGLPNAGDLKGTSVVVEAEDRGVFRSNLTRAPDVVLTVVP